jgi:predicted small secreted protein
MRLRKTSAVIAAAAAAAFSLTACDGEDSSDTGAAKPSAVSGSPSGAGATAAPEASGGGGGQASASGSASDPGSGAPSATSAGGICRTADLAFTSSGGMAEGEVLINLENTGSASCSMHGFPGLDLKGDDGTVSAERNSGRSAPTVTLAPGERTNFSLYFPPNTSGGSGVTFTSAVVTPPDETHSHSMSLSVNIAAGSGSASRVTVTPVGSGK